LQILGKPFRRIQRVRVAQAIEDAAKFDAKLLC